MMNREPITLSRTIEKIRKLYSENREEGGQRIADFLSSELSVLSADQKIDFIRTLLPSFKQTGPETPRVDSQKDEVVARLFSLVFGKKLSAAELSSDERLRKLAASLNTIFNALNQLIGLINQTFTGQAVGRETIRQVMGFHLEDREQSQSLEIYLGQIKKAFLAIQQAFLETTQKIMEELLRELDPVRLKNVNNRLFEVSRKAEAFDLYEQQFEKCRKWFESGKATRDFLREFEKTCQKIKLD